MNCRRSTARLNEIDVCMLIEGGYPYVVGGVSSWTNALIRSLPNLRFHVMALIISSQSRQLRYDLPDNVEVTDVILDGLAQRHTIFGSGVLSADEFAASVASILTNDDGKDFARLMRRFENSNPASSHLCDSREAWKAMEKVNRELLPTAPLLDFFWAWRFLTKSILAISAVPLPNARLYHAVSTGYAGLLGARAKCVTGRPLVVTEHGIYANERRIEIAVSEWIYEAGCGGFDVSTERRQLMDLWLGAFGSFSRIAYNLADRITTLFEANQVFQIMDGAQPEKLTIIRNGIELDGPDSGIAPQSLETPPRQLVLFVGRVVPIKDLRTFILAIDCLRHSVPSFDALVIGPEDEDPAYVAECKFLVNQLGLKERLRFLGGRSNIRDYLAQADVLVLTSISEGQPLVLLEAGAVGLPAVVTDVGSCREILEGAPDEVGREPGGIVVPPCNPRAVAEAIARILVNPSLKTRMGATMRQRVERFYNQAKSAEEYSMLYSSLASAQ